MKMSMIVKGGIYKVKEPGIAKCRLFLVIGGNGTRSENNRNIISCMRIHHPDMRKKYDIPIYLTNGRVSCIATDAIYAFYADLLTPENFLGAVADTAYYTTQEFLELLYGIYTYNIGMSVVDADDLVTEYLEKFSEEFGEIEPVARDPVKIEKRVDVTARNFYTGAFNDAFKRLGSNIGPSELAEMTGKPNLDAVQQKFVQSLDDSNNVAPAPLKKSTRKSRSPEALYGDDDLHKMMVEFKTNVFDVSNVHPRKNDANLIGFFIPLYELAREQSRISEFARVMGYNSSSSLHYMYNEFSKENKAQ